MLIRVNLGLRKSFREKFQGYWITIFYVSDGLAVTKSEFSQYCKTVLQKVRDSVLGSVVTIVHCEFCDNV